MPDPTAASPPSEERVREYEQRLRSLAAAHRQYADNCFNHGLIAFGLRKDADAIDTLLSDRTALTARLEALESLMVELATELRDDARTGEVRGKRHLDQAARAYAMIEHRLPSAADVIHSLREFDAKYLPDVHARAEANDEYDAEGHKR